MKVQREHPPGQLAGPAASDDAIVTWQSAEDVPTKDPTGYLLHELSESNGPRTPLVPTLWSIKLTPVLSYIEPATMGLTACQPATF